MTADEAFKAAEALSRAGYAVAVIAPDQLRGADANSISVHMRQAAQTAIDMTFAAVARERRRMEVGEPRLVYEMELAKDPGCWKHWEWRELVGERWRPCTRPIEWRFGFQYRRDPLGNAGERLATEVQLSFA